MNNKISRMLSVGDLSELLHKTPSRVRSLNLNFQKTKAGLQVAFEDVIEYVENHKCNLQTFQLLRLKRMEGRVYGEGVRQ